MLWGCEVIGPQGPKGLALRGQCHGLALRGQSITDNNPLIIKTIKNRLPLVASDQWKPPHASSTSPARMSGGAGA